MEERQKIQAELQRMREECVRDYLEEKLQQITSKEVIHDILQEFLQVNNQQFLASIADNIQEAKQQNRALKAQLQTIKEQAEIRLQQAAQAIHQECQQMLIQEVAGVRKHSEAELTQLRAKIEALQQSNQALQQQRQQLLASLKAKQSEGEELQKLKIELAESKRSFINFKDSCERIIYEGNRDKEREKQRMLEEWKHTKEELESQIADQRSSKALSQELQAQRKKIQAKDEEILQVDKALQSALAKLEEFNEINAELSLNYQLVKQKQSQNMTQLANLGRIIQSNQLSIDYLKEENNYLREQILGFSSRYQQLQKQKSILSKQAKEYKQILMKRTQQYEIIQNRQKQQFTLAMTQYKTKYDADISQLMNDLSKMKDEIETYSQQIVEKDNCLIAISDENASLQKIKYSLQEQLNNMHNNNERLELQVKQFEAEVMNVKQQCRTDIENIKQTFENNWNAKNEEVIEQKFICHQLNEKISELNSNIDKLKQEIQSLQHDISIKNEKDQYYKLVTEEIKALKNKFSPQKTEYHLSHRFMNKDSKIYFIICKMNKQISLLKKSNQQLRAFALKSVADISTYIQQATAYTLAKAQPHQLILQEPIHQVNLKKNIQLKLLIREKDQSLDKKDDYFVKREECLRKKEQSFNRTVQQQRGNSQSNNNFTQIKKTLKNIQQRYQTVQQENKFYSTYLDSYIKPT